jgi:hypothetical protein
MKYRGLQWARHVTTKEEHAKSAFRILFGENLLERIHLESRGE